MNQREAIARALSAAESANVIEIWGPSGGDGGYFVLRSGARHRLTLSDLLTHLPQWVRATVPTDTASWQNLLDRMEDLAETCRWWGELGSVDFPAESSPIPLEEEARGRATDSLLTALDLADQIARRLDLPRVRIRIANARREVPR